MKETKVLVVGPNCWGKGDTIEQAKREAKKHWPRYGSRHFPYVAYRVSPETRVDEMGMMIWKSKNPRPVEIERVEPKKRSK